MQDPGAYGQLGLSDLFEMREECLREFGFSDVYRLDKEAENDVALQVRAWGCCARGCMWLSGGACLRVLCLWLHVVEWGGVLRDACVG
jgi:hypothetical protein